jgi:hypothetical protein
MNSIKEKPSFLKQREHLRRTSQRCIFNNNNSIPQKNKKINNYNAYLFDDIKQQLDIRYVLEVYGVQFNAKGIALCPFHSEKTPSFKVYNNSFYCFGCGAGGTVVDFVMRTFNLSNIDAAKRLNSDFNLNLFDASSTATSSVSIERIKQNKQILADFIEWEKRAYRAVAGYYKLLRAWGEFIYIKQYAYFEKYLHELDNILFIEDLLDTMIENTSNIDKQIEFYEIFGEVVNEIERNYPRACGTVTECEVHV